MNEDKVMEQTLAKCLADLKESLASGTDRDPEYCRGLIWAIEDSLSKSKGD